MADEAVAELGGRTPLEAAYTPILDKIAPLSRMGTLKTIPKGYHPGSEVANMSVLGYDLDGSFEGRGPLEAASIGVDVDFGELAMRCNLISIENGLIKSHSAGHISTEESGELLLTLSEQLGNDSIHFYRGISYRHLMKVKGADKRIRCTPPHDVPGIPYQNVLVKPLCKEANPTAELLNRLIVDSQQILAHHPVNLQRKQLGKAPANSIWPWSPGYRPSMQTLQERFGIGEGVVISAVDLIRGIGIYAGLKPIHVEGATGLWNTNYEGKVEATIQAMQNNDFVFLHIEAIDEAGHERNVELKIKTIENLDKRVCGPIFKAVEDLGEVVRIALLPDHPTPCRLRTHTSSPVPVLIFEKGSRGDGILVYNEKTAAYGTLGEMEHDDFIKEFLKH